MMDPLYSIEHYFTYQMSKILQLLLMILDTSHNNREAYLYYKGKLLSHKLNAILPNKKRLKKCDITLPQYLIRVQEYKETMEMILKYNIIFKYWIQNTAIEHTHAEVSVSNRYSMWLLASAP